MKIGKKILSLGIAAFILNCSLLFSSEIYAADILNEATETVLDYSEDTQYSVLRGNILNLGNAKISKLSSNSISVYGMTQCHRKCDNVYLSLYLERKVNGSYATYKSWDYSTTNASNLSKSLVVSVPKGYYYRIRGYHAATDSGSSKESVTTLTNGVYVG